MWRSQRCDVCTGKNVRIDRWAALALPEMVAPPVMMRPSFPVSSPSTVRKPCWLCDRVGSVSTRGNCTWFICLAKTYRPTRLLTGRMRLLMGGMTPPEKATGPVLCTCIYVCVWMRGSTTVRHMSQTERKHGNIISLSPTLVYFPLACRGCVCNGVKRHNHAERKRGGYLLAVAALLAKRRLVGHVDEVGPGRELPGAGLGFAFLHVGRGVGFAGLRVTAVHCGFGG